MVNINYENYFLTYNNESDEIVPVRYFDGVLMSKQEAKVVVELLTNYIGNDLTNEDIDSFNKIQRMYYSRSLSKNVVESKKSERDGISKSLIDEGLVYLIKEHMNGTYKIGKTKDLDSRTKIFGVKLPFKWDILKVIESKDYNLTELLFHKKYRDKRIDGEWFVLSDEDVNDILNDNFGDEIIQSIDGGGDLYDRT